jgi:hypothetical protein
LKRKKINKTVKTQKQTKKTIRTQRQMKDSDIIKRPASHYKSEMLVV